MNVSLYMQTETEPLTGMDERTETFTKSLTVEAKHSVSAITVLIRPFQPQWLLNSLIKREIE